MLNINVGCRALAIAPPGRAVPAFSDEVTPVALTPRLEAGGSGPYAEVRP